jgi:hypothetical protein
MIQLKEFTYKPREDELEKASNSYLMSLIFIVVGLPIPIINLFATFIFLLGNRRSSYFVRWHCTQALLSQLSMLFINSVGFWWTISLIFENELVTKGYILYIVIVLLINLTEFITTIYSAIQIRKGIHVEWLFYGSITNILVGSR